MKTIRFFLAATVAALTLSAMTAQATVKSAGWGLDGLWFNPGIDSQGFDIKYIQRADGKEELFVSWFTYDIGGTKHAWIVAQGDLFDGSATMTATETYGGQFNNATVAGRADVGTITVQLVDCNNALVSWAINAPHLKISNVGSSSLIRLSPLAQNNGRTLCDGEPTGVAQSDDSQQFVPLIGKGRISIYTLQGVPVQNDRSHAQGPYYSFTSNLDYCSDADYSAYCTATGKPVVTIYDDVDEGCVGNRLRVEVPGNPVAITDKFFAYLTDGRVRVQRTSDLRMIVDESAKITSTVDASNTVAGFITSNRVRVVDLNGTLLADENASSNARVSVSDTMYAYVSGNLWRVYRTKDRSKVFETTINNDNNPIIRVTNSRAYFFGSNTTGFVVNYDGSMVGSIN